MSNVSVAAAPTSSPPSPNNTSSTVIFFGAGAVVFVLVICGSVFRKAMRERDLLVESTTVVRIRFPRQKTMFFVEMFMIFDFFAGQSIHSKRGCAA